MVRGLARLPLIGRPVRIAVAVIRLPETRAAWTAAADAQNRLAAEAVDLAAEANRLAAESQARQAAEIEALRRAVDGPQPAVQEVVARYEDFANRQLPGLLDTITEMNGRLVARTSAVDNLVRSVPVALRNAARDAAATRERLGGIERRVADLDAAQATQRSDVARELMAFEARVAAAGAATDEARATFIGEATAIRDAARGLTSTVEYLLGRVEFVRRELLFEMRYGAARKSDGDSLRATAEIISVDKVADARRRGLRLNLGCGHVALDGYINVDRRALPGVDVVAEIDDLPFDEGEAEEIFSAHVLEHFPQEQLRRELLGYWRRLLKPDGVFAAVVPDADGMAKAYLSGEYGFEQFRNVTFGGQDYDGDFHYNMLSPASLSALLEEAGFADVEVVAANRENGGCKEFEVRARNGGR